MCLVALALGCSERFPLVVAANRDEYFGRAADELAWWRPQPGQVAMLGGRDVDSNGTWMALSAAGRMGIVTNVRGARNHDAQAPSRGSIVAQWLNTTRTPRAFREQVRAARHNPYNFVAGDLARGEWFWTSNVAPDRAALPVGLYGLSNGGLDTPWPKVVALKDRMRQALSAALDAPPLASALFAALADRAIAPDTVLPATGLRLERERALSAAFIHGPEAGYGTRCSTLLIGERLEPGALRLQVVERSFDAAGICTGEVARSLPQWPLPPDHMPHGG